MDEFCAEYRIPARYKHRRKHYLRSFRCNIRKSCRMGSHQVSYSKEH